MAVQREIILGERVVINDFPDIGDQVEAERVSEALERMRSSISGGSAAMHFSSAVLAVHSGDLKTAMEERKSMLSDLNFADVGYHQSDEGRLRFGRDATIMDSVVTSSIARLGQEESRGF